MIDITFLNPNLLCATGLFKIKLMINMGKVTLAQEYSELLTLKGFQNNIDEENLNDTSNNTLYNFAHGLCAR